MQVSGQGPEQLAMSTIKGEQRLYPIAVWMPNLGLFKPLVVVLDLSGLGISPETWEPWNLLSTSTRALTTP